MGTYSGTCEIVEATEELKPVQQSRWEAGDKDGKLKMVYKDSLNNDINQIFEAINLKGPKGLNVSYQGGATSSSSKKNALKKPIGVGMPQSPRISGSPSLSLKQSLRDHCISKASEMAVTKRLSMSISSPAHSEAGRIKNWFNSVVVEHAGGSDLRVDENKGSRVEVSLVPEKSKSTSSRVIAVPREAPLNKLLSQSADSSPQFARARTETSIGTFTSIQSDVSASIKVGTQAPKAVCIFSILF